MNIQGLSIYILIWPFLSSAVLLLLCVALTRDMIAARRNGTDLI